MIKQAGQLDQRIILQSAAVSADAFGQAVESFSTNKTVWAKVIEKGGSEGEEGNDLTAVKKVEFIIRYDSAVNELWRISYRSEIYTIEAILNTDARKEFMRIITRWQD